jgi:hypothetical protein
VQHSIRICAEFGCLMSSQNNGQKRGMEEREIVPSAENVAKKRKIRVQLSEMQFAPRQGDGTMKRGYILLDEEE